MYISSLQYDSFDNGDDESSAVWWSLAVFVVVGGGGGSVCRGPITGLFVVMFAASFGIGAVEPTNISSGTLDSAPRRTIVVVLF